jgi:hypothetical protein
MVITPCYAAFMAKLITRLAFFDGNPVLDTSQTPIPAVSSPPMQVIEKMPAGSDSVQIYDSTGRHIEVMVGPVGQEHRAGIVGGGIPNGLPLIIQPGVRVSLRHLGAQVVNRGAICLQFVTQPIQHDVEI